MWNWYFHALWLHESISGGVVPLPGHLWCEKLWNAGSFLKKNLLQDGKSPPPGFTEIEVPLLPWMRWDSDEFHLSGIEDSILTVHERRMLCIVIHLPAIPLETFHQACHCQTKMGISRPSIKVVQVNSSCNSTLAQSQVCVTFLVPTSNKHRMQVAYQSK